MSNVLMWSLVLIGLVLGAFVIAVQVKKRLVRPDDASGPGFTLADLRELHRSGKMTDDEFEKAKRVIFSASRPPGRSPPAKAPGPAPSAEADRPNPG